jgi:hypothetical protein
MQNHPKHPRRDDGDAFIPDPSVHDGPTRGADAEFLAEEFLTSATTGEAVEQDAADEVVEEELGGPFLEEGTEEEDVADTLPEPPSMSSLR